MENSNKICYYFILCYNTIKMRKNMNIINKHDDNYYCYSVTNLIRARSHKCTCTINKSDNNNKLL